MVGLQLKLLAKVGICSVNFTCFLKMFYPDYVGKFLLKCLSYCTVLFPSLNFFLYPVLVFKVLRLSLKPG